MTSTSPMPTGIWLPLVTPFLDGELDEKSLRQLVRHFASTSIDGLILCATTGESLTLDDDEKQRMVAIAQEELAACGAQIPVYLGISGSDTRRVVSAMVRYENWAVSGYLINAPAYNRPGQAGLIKHFECVAGSTNRPCLLYNVPYRSGVDMTNETLLQLAATENIIGLKDCSGNFDQSAELLLRKPADFSILTGEDALFYTALMHGAEGGIVMAGHILGVTYAAIRRQLLGGDWRGALNSWRVIADIPGLLFDEPSPAPVKYWLWRNGLIASPELRLPMCGVSDSLARRIDDRKTKFDMELASL